MKFASKLAATAVLCSVSALAMAAPTGFFIEAGLGYAFQPCDLCDTTMTGGGGKLALGWRFNNYFAIQGGIAGGTGNWDSPDFGRTSLSTSTTYAAVEGIVPFAENWEVFGRIGYGSSVTKGLSSTYYVYSDREAGPMFGGGIGYLIPNSTVSARLSYDRFSKDRSMEVNDAGTNSGPAGLDLLSLSLVLDF